MKKRTIILAIFILAFVIMFFPVSSTHNISGNGDVLNVQKEKIGECKLDIEITEISSLIICYKMILSILVYTFFSRMFDLMLPPVVKHSIVVA